MRVRFRGTARPLTLTGETLSKRTSGSVTARDSWWSEVMQLGSENSSNESTSVERRVCFRSL